MDTNICSLKNGIKAISNDIGILYHIIRASRLPLDPYIINYSVWPCNTEFLGQEKYNGRSSGCGYEWEDAILTTIGETVERYAPVFYDPGEFILSSFKNLKEHAIPPVEYALFHDKQFIDNKYIINKFTNDIEVSWVPTIDLTNGKKTFTPAQFIYLPFTRDNNWITCNTSTGLAAHTNYYKAILNGLYECIERDSFVITWMQNIVSPKIILSREIEEYINDHFPGKYEFHFFDITYDLEFPTVFGLCIGEADYGKFIAVGSSTRATIGDALKKVILEIGQTAPYFRYLLGEKKDWIPSNDFTELDDFENHSIFYLKRLDLWGVFEKWIKAKETKKINFNETQVLDDQNQIIEILKMFKEKNYNVLFKDITTPDIRQIGYYSIKIFIPQLLQMSGTYSLYFLGGDRLYSVPEIMGYKSHNFENLNHYPHPFP